MISSSFAWRSCRLGVPLAVAGWAVFATSMAAAAPPVWGGDRAVVHEGSLTWPAPVDGQPQRPGSPEGPPVGACCNGELDCSIVTEEVCVSEGLQWLGPETTCDQCPVVPDCPADSLFAQTAVSYDQGPAAFASEAGSGFRRWENFNGVGGAIHELTWWGFDLKPFGNSFVECEETDNTFEIAFREDAAGTLGAEVCSTVVIATRTPTGITFAGFELNEYHAELPEPCLLIEGWVSIVGLGDPQCWFMWLNSLEGDDLSHCEGCTIEQVSEDLNICLQGQLGGIFGACCDTGAASCENNVEIVDCTASNLRFEPDTLCDDLVPPCGVQVGACCNEVDLACENDVAESDCIGPDLRFEPDGFCDTLNPPCGEFTGACCQGTEFCTEDLSEADCTFEGHSWIGPGTTCDECPDLPVCPPDSLYSTPVPDPIVDGWVAWVSEFGTGFEVSDSFSGVGGAIEAVTWYGLDMMPNVGHPPFIECEEPDPTFEVRFHKDANGAPGPVVCSYFQTATRTPTQIVYNGGELNEYTIALESPCILTKGWITIVGYGDPGCYFLWMSSPQGGFSFCLRGQLGGVFGACCHDADGSCEDEKIEITQCLGAEDRFLPDATCDQFDPPCGTLTGACCFADGTCFIDEQIPCENAGGLWVGADSICSQCPCQVVCPPEAMIEGEPVCTEGYIDGFNGGCLSPGELFQPLPIGGSVCATSGVFESGPNFQDYDYYEITMAEPGGIFAYVVAEFPVNLSIRDGRFGCPGELLGESTSQDPCEQPGVSVAAHDPGVYWIIVTPNDFADSAACGAPYTLYMDPPIFCSAPGDVNQDFAVDGGDVAAFVDCILTGSTSPGSCFCADMDGLNGVSVDDLGLFVDALLGA